jgi:hypothetical protein
MERDSEKRSEVACRAVPPCRESAERQRAKVATRQRGATVVKAVRDDEYGADFPSTAPKLYAVEIGLHKEKSYDFLRGRPRRQKLLLEDST